MNLNLGRSTMLYQNQYFLNWWVIFCSVCLLSILSYWLGIFDRTNTADVTKLSFLIYGLFLGFTVYAGITTHTLRTHKTPTARWLDLVTERMDLPWFISDVLLSLGLLGTIIGIIFTLESGFMTADPGNSANLRTALQVMGKGMGTALYTTASGLICSVILKLQLFNITKNIEYLEKKLPPPKRPLPLQLLAAEGVRPDENKSL